MARAWLHGSGMVGSGRVWSGMVGLGLFKLIRLSGRVWMDRVWPRVWLDRAVLIPAISLGEFPLPESRIPPDGQEKHPKHTKNASNLPLNMWFPPPEHRV